MTIHTPSKTDCRGWRALVASEAMAASKQHPRSYDLRFEIGNIDYLGVHVHIIASNSLDDL